jgi:hypothetical protein
LREKEFHLNHREIDVKGPHVEVRIPYKAREASPAKEAARWVQADRPSHFGPIRAPFDLAASQTIYKTLAKSHGSTHSSFIAEEQRREGHHSGEERVELVV